MSQVSSEVQRLGYHDTVSVRMWLAQKVEVPPPSSDPHTDLHVYYVWTSVFFCCAQNSFHRTVLNTLISLHVLACSQRLTKIMCGLSYKLSKIYGFTDISLSGARWTQVWRLQTNELKMVFHCSIPFHTNNISNVDGVTWHSKSLAPETVFNQSMIQYVGTPH